MRWHGAGVGPSVKKSDADKMDVTSPASGHSYVARFPTAALVLKLKYDDVNQKNEGQLLGCP